MRFQKFCSFVLLQNFKDRLFGFVTTFQWWSVFFGNGHVFYYEISIPLCFVARQWKHVRDFNISRFCWVMRFQWWTVLLGYEISTMVGFVWLRDVNDGHFCWVMSFIWLWELNDGNFSVSACFVLLWDFKDCWFCSFVLLWNFKDRQFGFVTRFLWQSVFFGYEISVMFGFQCQSVSFCYKISIIGGFVRLRDLIDGNFSVSVGFVLLWDFKDFVPLFFYKISKTDCLVLLQHFNDGQFCSVTAISSIMRFQCHSVLLLKEILMMVCFAFFTKFLRQSFFFSLFPLQDITDGRF